ncbi:MAG: YcfL family protein [Opitutaceae bacterium]|jgi:uncharacterized protein YcfL|nr:YcfL family protein [Opitutaceae bacterium]
MKNKIAKPALATAALGALLLATGCATSVNTYQRAQSQATVNYIDDQRLVTDTTLARALAVRSLNEARPGGLLQVQATIENLKTSAKTLHYKFEWIAQNGMVAGDTGWRTLFLQGRETSAISALATSPSAVDFRLSFKE